MGAQAQTYPYLEDATPPAKPANPPGTPSMDHHKFPRLMLGDSRISRGAQQNRYAKYHIIGVESSSMNLINEIQKDYPDLVYFRMYNPRETQEYQLNTYCSQKAIPFEGDAAATGGCKVYPGHWLYRAGKKTTSWTSATATTINVNDAGSFTVGRYVVIYDAPAGSFNNTEHAKIISKNASAGTITLQRGYKSTPRAHPSGSIVAQHVIGQIGDPENWAYNLSTQCPRDANGMQINAYSARFLRDTIATSWDGRKTDIKVSGILFDVDYHIEMTTKLADVNNDLVTDNGFSPTGVNWYGDGMNVFYSKVREYFPNLYISGGTDEARGDGILSGTQMEGWLTGFRGQPIDYSKIDKQMSDYSYHMNYQAGPIHSNTLLKQGTQIHPSDGNRHPNSVARLALGATLMEDGYFGHQTHSGASDTWYDEFGVDVEPNSPSYGQAIPDNPDDVSVSRRHRGWLGMPVGKRKRVYDEKFAPSNSLISNATFDSNLNSWSGNNVNVSRVTSNTMDGAGALRASTHTSYQSNIYSAAVRGPSPSLTSGKEYSLTFSARSPVLRQIDVYVGNHKQRFMVGPEWRRYVYTFQATKSGSQRVSFNLGRENTVVFLDTVHLFEGNANIFRRDFENGIAIVNATPSTKTVALGGTFQRILGTQDPSHNNGRTVSSVTLAKYDAILLVRPDGQGGTSPTDPEPEPEPSPGGEECGAPSYNPGSAQAIYLWKDCQGDGSWHFRVTGGGSSSTVSYEGDVTSSSGFTNVSGYSLEGSDVLNVSGSNLTYNLLARQAWEDGVDFSLPSSTNACFDSSSHSNVRLGSGAVSKSLPIDLNTLMNCGTNSGSGPQPGTECSSPNINAGSERGAYLWKDCNTTGTWHLRVAAGGRTGTATQYMGNITSSDPISASAYSLESNDTLNTGDNRNISYTMYVYNSAQDGLDFSVSNSGGCFSLSGASDGNLYLGRSKTPVSGSVDLNNLGSCQ
jgi:hypothetical protein